MSGIGVLNQQSCKVQDHHDFLLELGVCVGMCGRVCVGVGVVCVCGVYVGGGEEEEEVYMCN